MLDVVILITLIEDYIFISHFTFIFYIMCYFWTSDYYGTVTVQWLGLNHWQFFNFRQGIYHFSLPLNGRMCQTNCQNKWIHLILMEAIGSIYFFKWIQWIFGGSTWNVELYPFASINGYTGESSIRHWKPLDPF